MLFRKQSDYIEFFVAYSFENWNYSIYKPWSQRCCPLSKSDLYHRSPSFSDKKVIRSQVVIPRKLNLRGSTHKSPRPPTYIQLATLWMIVKTLGLNSPFGEKSNLTLQTNPRRRVNTIWVRSDSRSLSPFEEEERDLEATSLIWYDLGWGF